MQWPWHVSWWLTVAGIAVNGLALLTHSERKAATAEELIGVRIIWLTWGGFWLWFLSNYAPWSP